MREKVIELERKERPVEVGLFPLLATSFIHVTLWLLPTI